MWDRLRTPPSWRVFVLPLCLAASAAALHAQAAQQGTQQDDPRAVAVSPVLEFRAAAPLGDDPEFQLGPGVSLRAGWYVRASLALLGGAVQRDSALHGVARVEAAARFHLDPFFEAPGCSRGERSPVCRGIYAGVGLSQRFEGGGGRTDSPVVMLLVGIEGRSTRSGVWALEAGVGGGVRVGVAWRQNRRDGYR